MLTGPAAGSVSAVASTTLKPSRTEPIFRASRCGTEPARGGRRPCPSRRNPLSSFRRDRLPPEAVRPPHRVGDHETFATVAQKSGVPVETLIRHNFRTLDPSEINWYLREYVGCKLSTADGRNWRFSAAASPGLIWIPKTVLEMDPVLITGQVPGLPSETVPKGGPAHLANVIKFAHEFKTKEFEVGYFAFQFKLAVEGEVSSSSLTTVQVKKDSIKAGIEGKLTEDVKGAFALKLEKVRIEDVAAAVKAKDWKGFLKKFAGAELGLKGGLSLGPVDQWEGGLDFARLPVFFKVGGSVNEKYMLPEPVVCKLTVKGGIHAGPSKKGWAWIAQRVGAEALKDFISAGGRSLAGLWEMLVAEGIVMAGGIALGTILGTLGITYLTARMVDDAKKKGELTGLATWYGSAYIAKVFRRNRPDNFIIGDTKLRDELRLAGEKDAIRHATEIVQRRNESAQYPTETAALERYRELAIALYRTEENAEFELRKVLDAHARKLVGL
jgi:hypothetical protein